MFMKLMPNMCSEIAIIKLQKHLPRGNKLIEIKVPIQYKDGVLTV